MCGRFTSTWPSYDDLVRVLGGLLGVAAVADDALLYRPRWNVAPMDRHWVVRLPQDRGAPVLAPATWGLVAPGHAADARPIRPMINARSETVDRLPSFRGAFRARRCVVPVDGFYEWVGPQRARRPIWFHPAGEEVLRLAGLWEPVVGARTGAPDATFTILTTSANDVVAAAHDRMPVVLAAEDVEAWLHGSPDDARTLLRPCAESALEATAVSSRTNRVENDDAACLEPWAAEAEEAAPRPAPRPRKAKPTRDHATLPLFGAPLAGPQGRRAKAE